MLRKIVITIGSFFIVNLCSAQKDQDSIAIDTTFADFDELFSELDALLDSLIAPRSFTMFNVNIGQSFLTYQGKSESATQTKRQLSYSPSVGYFDKTGFGLGIGASLVNDGTGMNPYQFSITGSYDFQQSRSFITGVSLTHYVSQADLPFYTSPLQNEVYGYFTYRKLWLKPSVGVSYGWGSRDDFEEREQQIQEINLTRNGFTRINTQESVIDFNIATSVRHDFYFLNSLSSDYIRITPQISFVSGTQQFGFNQTSNTYATVRRTGRNILYNTENVALDDQLYFQPVSLSTFLKAEYAKGKFYLQPQFILDYYFPASSNNFSTAFVINAGFIF
ncbi:MAG: hypothetical protein ACXWWD_09920 [Chitinophagaceae bacterium]